MSSVWTLKASGLLGGSNRVYLVGCHITTNSAVPPTAYLFTLPNITQVLATSPGSTLPTSSFTFPAFEWDGNNWTIEVTTLPGPGGAFGGSWNTAPGADGTGDEDGTWTAQAGAGAGDDEACDDEAGDDEPETATSTVA